MGIYTTLSNSMSINAIESNPAPLLVGRNWQKPIKGTFWVNVTDVFVVTDVPGQVATFSYSAYISQVNNNKYTAKNGPRFVERNDIWFISATIEAQNCNVSATLIGLLSDTDLV